MHVSRRRRRAALLLVAGAAAANLFVASTSALAATTTDVFELDGNIANNPASPQPDWSDFFTPTTGTNPPVVVSPLPANFVDAGFDQDFVPGGTADDSTYTGGSKDILNISSGWSCVGAKNVTDKGDIQNAYATAYRDPVNGHLMVFFGLEKNAPNGDNNIGLWLLKDNNTACSNPKDSGPGVPFTGNHVDGDLLLVAAFLNGGTNPVINAYRWVGGAGGSLNLTPLATGGKCGTPGSEAICAITNTGSVTPPWPTQNKNPAGNTLGADQFFEGGVDLTANNLEGCFNKFLANTRSSQSPTATLYDYSEGSLVTCGPLHVNKYIDVDLSGTHNAGDIATGTPVTNWSFTVTRNSDNAVVCTGTTDGSGALVCSSGSISNLTPGAYTVTESQKSGFFNSDPGPIPNTGLTVSKTVNVTVQGGSVEFGNTCFVDKTFQITSVPAGMGTIKVDWQVVSGPGSPSSGTLDLTTSGTTASGSVNDTFVQTNSISWQWYLASDPSRKVTGGLNESLAGGAYPVCAVTNTATFPLTTITGLKYKDINANGAQDPGEGGVGGFHFTLTPGGASTTSAANGTFSFSGLAPGTYTIHEPGETGWLQTDPANNGDRTVTVHLGDTSVDLGKFGNTPLPDIGATFAALAKTPAGGSTDATQATITCVDSHGNVVASGTSSASGQNLLIGTYTCTIVITDP